MIRRITSMALPGAESVMIRTGRVGKSCAAAGVPTRLNRTRSHTDANMQLRCAVIMSSLDARGALFLAIYSAPAKNGTRQASFRSDRESQRYAGPGLQVGRWGLPVFP